MRGQILGFNVVLLALLATAALAYASECNVTIRVVEEREVTPDLYLISVGIELQDDNATRLSLKVISSLTKFLELLEGSGVPRKNVTVGSWSLEPLYNRSMSPPKLVGYQARVMVKVRVTRPETIGKVVGATVAAGFNKMEKIEMRLSPEKRERVYLELLESAGLKARKRAEALARGLGMRVGRVIGVNRETRIRETFFDIPLALHFKVTSKRTPMNIILPVTEGVKVKGELSVTFELYPG